MRKLRWIGLVLLLAVVPGGPAPASGWRKDSPEIHAINHKLAGQVIDRTANHGKDNRIWARTLWERRDLYVYLPPGYNACNKYPLMIWLHGLGDDERSFLRYVVPVIDEAIRSGKLPPLIVAAPDGSRNGEGDRFGSGTFFMNSSAGDFADFVLQDVWDHVATHYPIRHEREAHILAGHSMGGFAAYNFAILHREAFGAVIGIQPPLNVRWVDKKGNYYSAFDPYEWSWQQGLGDGRADLWKKNQPTLLRSWFGPLYGETDFAIHDIARENPIEMIDRLRVAPCQLEMYVGYTGDDPYNIAAQVESFLYLAKWRGLNVGVGYEPHGKHHICTAEKLLPKALCWLAPRIAPYAPCGEDCCAAPGSGQFRETTRFLQRRILGNRRPRSDVGYPHTLPDPEPTR